MPGIYMDIYVRPYRVANERPRLVLEASKRQWQLLSRKPALPSKPRQRRICISEMATIAALMRKVRYLGSLLYIDKAE